MSQLRVLIIDDDASVCEFLHELLTPDGCEIVSINDPHAGLALLKSAETFHILILDLKMPGINGIELLDQIRKFNKDIAAIILTAFPSLESATDAINLDVSAYMQKPFSGEEMRETIARVARKKGIVVRREDELHITIGKRIREVRKKRELTLKQMGRRTNLSVSLLSQIERAESSASVSSLYKIANALDVRIVELFGDF
ncbi:Transcriptional regulatory protein ZraR [Enhygromyxa salina]|uniref:Transcriptional regulatory protein ZraR n=1 Tax=Enhygromyxa salina TaxID=215803 RepID=A0A2S9YI74_9BACT|nr:response regulator [Enhygromyxa salina]PRQ04716.1 Transcriptional regulatory protein ZraR [Enhygromyxa salina]